MNNVVRPLQYGLKCYPDSTAARDIRRVNYISRKPLYDFYSEKAELLSGGVVLDFGCGDMPYKSLFHNAEEYIGLDVDTAREYGFSAGGIVYYDGKTIPFETKSIDFILAVEVFAHIENLDGILDEIYRVMKNGGVLCFSVPMAYPLMYRPYDFRRFTRYGIDSLLKGKGFEEIVIIGSTKPVDTIRLLRIRETVFHPFVNKYSLYANLMYLLGRTKFYGNCVTIENKLRHLLKRKDKSIDFEEIPLDYCVCCRKKAE